jgi:hypothetical protein
MSVLVENWPPVSVYADVNLKLLYSTATKVQLVPIDGDAPAYIPVIKVGTSEVRMAKIEAGDALNIETTVQGIGGLEEATVKPDTGYDVYVLVKDDLSILGAIAAVHGEALTNPLGYGNVYISKPIRYFCVNAGASNESIQPFVETAPRETFYAGIGTAVQILAADTDLPKEVVRLAVPPTIKACFPGTARKVIVQIVASNSDAETGALAIYLNDAATPLFTLGNIGPGAGECASKTATVIVPCRNAGTMDATDLMKAWITGGTPHCSVDVYALGYQL